jgi:hypothetical protein
MQMEMKQSFCCLFLAMLLTNVTGGSSVGQHTADDQELEQTIFDAEPNQGEMLVKRSVEIPDSGLQVLRDTLTGGTFNCLKARGTTPAQAPASWFLASAVHLNGPNEVDLIVLPNVPNIAKPTNPGGCLLPAHGGPFWVLGPGIASGRYGLLLETYGLRLEVFSSRTNRYKDIQIGSGRTAALYKFAVQQYQLAEKKTEP